jgi:hypothetical protein
MCTLEGIRRGEEGNRLMKERETNGRSTVLHIVILSDLVHFTNMAVFQNPLKLKRLDILHKLCISH